MSHRHALWMSSFLLALVLQAAHATDAATPDGLERARAAANAGDAAAALVLYDAWLRDSPGDVEALNESAQQLSWAGRTHRPCCLPPATVSPFHQIIQTCLPNRAV